MELKILGIYDKGNNNYRIEAKTNKITQILIEIEENIKIQIRDDNFEGSGVFLVYFEIDSADKNTFIIELIKALFKYIKGYEEKHKIINKIIGDE